MSSTSHRPRPGHFSGPHQRRQEEKLGVVRVSFKAQVTCISWHMCALRGNEKRSAWECKSKDTPQTERNAIDAQNERPHSAQKIIREKSSGRGAHLADLLSAYRAWRKVVRATRPERVVLFASPSHFGSATQRRNNNGALFFKVFGAPWPLLSLLLLRRRLPTLPTLHRYRTGSKNTSFFLPPGSLCWDRTMKRQPRCVQPVPRFALLLKLAFTTVFPVFSRRDLTRLCPNGRARRRRRRRCRFLPLQIRNDRPRNQ